MRMVQGHERLHGNLDEYPHRPALPIAGAQARELIAVGSGGGCCFALTPGQVAEAQQCLRHGVQTFRLGEKYRDAKRGQLFQIGARIASPPANGQIRFQCQDALHVQPHSAAHLRQAARCLRIITERRDTDHAPASASGEQQFSGMWRETHDASCRSGQLHDPPSVIRDNNVCARGCGHRCQGEQDRHATWNGCVHDLARGGRTSMKYKHR